MNVSSLPCRESMREAADIPVQARMLRRGDQDRLSLSPLCKLELFPALFGLGQEYPAKMLP